MTGARESIGLIGTAGLRCSWRVVAAASAARLCLERGADIHVADQSGVMAHHAARGNGHTTIAAWLDRIRAGGWAHHLSEPRYALAVLRALAARGRPRRRRAELGKEQLSDFLFPGDRPNKRARRQQPFLPDDLFAIVLRYYRGGGLSAEEEAAQVAEAAAVTAAEAAAVADAAAAEDY